MSNAESSEAGSGDGSVSGSGQSTIETDNPTIPVGFDAYRMWDRWPYIHVAERAYMRSTYDRAGGNASSDASHFLRATSDRAVPLDIAGVGVLQFSRFNHWHGSPWHYLVDGVDTVVQETDTANPSAPTANSTFIPANVFPSPLNLTWSTAKGADLIGTPIPFAQSLEIDYERTHYGTGYFIYDLFPQGARNLSQGIATWTPADPPQDVIDLLTKSGQDVAPLPPQATAMSGTVALPATGAVTLVDTTGPATVRAFKLTVPTADAAALAAARLRITWDDRSAYSIDAPVALFFGAGSLYNRAAQEYLVKAFPVNIRFSSGSVTLANYFPMPFFRSAHFELTGGGTAIANISWELRTVPYSDPSNWAGYLHATYVDHGTPASGKDLVLLDTTLVEGGGDWCGHVVGTSFIFSDQASFNTLEGDPRFFFDDSSTPQVQGTGTEEWGGGGDYWNSGQTSTLPFYGHPVGAPNVGSAANTDDRIESAYRFLLADLMPFGKNARLQLEHGGTDDSTEHYRSVAYWYGLPGACLVQTDALHVSDTADEQAHGYVSAAASGVDTLTSRYEWGVDHVGTTEVYPATQDTGRHTTGTSEFSLGIRPSNFGILLRRKLDYSYADQRAEVYVADAATPGAPFVDVGTWYLSGSNSCVFSNPASELSPISPKVEISNRQWRDDEFLIPRAVTDGRSKIRVRLTYFPQAKPLQPNAASPASAWSEFRYTAYVWTLPPKP
jgi:hypothetical protein